MNKDIINEQQTNSSSDGKQGIPSNMNNQIPVEDIDLESGEVIIREVAPQVENTSSVREIKNYSEKKPVNHVIRKPRKTSSSRGFGPSRKLNKRVRGGKGPYRYLYI